MIPDSVYRRAFAELWTPLGGLFADASVSEIMLNGHERVYVERRGRIEQVAARFASEEAMLSAISVLAQYVGRPFGREHPILEGRMPDGSRVEVIHGELVKGGPHMAIRRFGRESLDLPQLVRHGSLSEHSAELIRILVESKHNVLVSGGTGTGKTSLLNVLTGLIPPGERVVVLEDARELAPRGEHVVQLEARPADGRGRGAVGIRELFKATLRMRPDRIVVGEIRDGAALDLVQAMTSGHGGCLSTLHASHPRDALARLETMALMAGLDLPLVALRAQIAAGVDIVLQLERLRSGQRVVTHISEVTGIDTQGRYEIQNLFLRRGITRDQLGTLEATGAVPSQTERIQALGYELPSSSQHRVASRSLA